MKKLLPIISAAALLSIIVSAGMYVAGSLDKQQMQMLMIVGTILWFVSAPLWMGRQK